MEQKNRAVLPLSPPSTLLTYHDGGRPEILVVGFPFRHARTCGRNEGDIRPWRSLGRYAPASLPASSCGDGSECCKSGLPIPYGRSRFRTPLADCVEIRSATTAPLLYGTEVSATKRKDSELCVRADCLNRKHSGDELHGRRRFLCIMYILQGCALEHLLVEEGGDAI